MYSLYSIFCIIDNYGKYTPVKFTSYMCLTHDSKQYNMFLIDSSYYIVEGSCNMNVLGHKGNISKKYYLKLKE